MILKNNLKKYRDIALFNQKQLSKASGISVQTIWNIENNVKRDNGYTARTIVNIYKAIRIRMPKLKLSDLFPGKKAKIDL